MPVALLKILLKKKRQPRGDWDELKTLSERVDSNHHDLTGVEQCALKKHQWYVEKPWKNGRQLPKENQLEESDLDTLF